jgi:hypothetical protein
MATNLDGSVMERVVVFLGFTGSGKSTATKFILKDPSLRIERDLQVLHIFWKCLAREIFQSGNPHLFIKTYLLHYFTPKLNNTNI